MIFMQFHKAFDIIQTTNEFPFHFPFNLECDWHDQHERHLINLQQYKLWKNMHIHSRKNC